MLLIVWITYNVTICLFFLINFLPHHLSSILPSYVWCYHLLYSHYGVRREWHDSAVRSECLASRHKNTLIFDGTWTLQRDVQFFSNCLVGVRRSTFQPRLPSSLGASEHDENTCLQIVLLVLSITLCITFNKFSTAMRRDHLIVYKQVPR